MSRLSVTRFTATPPLLPLVFLVLCLCRSAPAVLSAPPPPNLRPPLQSRHYLIYADVPEDLAADLATRMDAMYEEYSRRLADFVADREIPRLQVYLFARQDDYLKFTGERLRNTGGVYIPKRNLLAAFLEGQGRDGLRRTLQHEAFHQFAYNAIGRNVPVWLNEGLAQLFEEGVWNGEEFILGQVPPRRVRQLQADFRNSRIIDFETLLRLTPEQWAANLTSDHDLGATEYNQSWAMVYFLVHAKDKYGKDKYRSRLIDMLRLLRDGRDADTAFQEAFSSNIAGFQARFTEYAMLLQPSDQATMIDRQSVLGDLLAELSRKGKRFTTVVAFKRAAIAGGYRMHYTKGELQWDSDPDLRVYFADLNGSPLLTSQLYFEPRAGAPLPDLVCRYTATDQLRTRFFRAEGRGDKIEHEVLVEPPGSADGGRARAE